MCPASSVQRRVEPASSGGRCSARPGSPTRGLPVPVPVERRGLEDGKERSMETCALEVHTLRLPQGEHRQGGRRRRGEEERRRGAAAWL